ncbi:mar1 putative transposase, putative [Trichomonas vaginalis G3]|uniref:Mar1 putative transposase, putative n=1 Tax=Trichomonas vaginalis (strain ATCC PRA-98 / G3) TaxID=412133 RepID=A2G3W1_TRIV3|nr:mar1 putative transposase, putative [Trichomonas vaginalis G3]|eukprot:XP_001301080.1 mar1 transposase [Trichomonas vaginalis G3]
MNKKAPIIKIDKKSPDQRKIKAILQALDEDPRASLQKDRGDDKDTTYNSQLLSAQLFELQTSVYTLGSAQP